MSFGFVHSQTDKSQEIGVYEQQLSEILHELRTVDKDEDRKLLNAKFKEKIEEKIEEDWFFDHPFRSLSSIGKIYSDDGEVCVISWNVEWENNQHDYWCYILKKEKRKDGHFVTELKDNSVMLPPQPKDILDAENWYGALYYDIQEVEKGRKTYYTLFGYDANNTSSTIKLLDVLHFAGKNLKLGYPFFETKDGFENRVYFEHSAKAQMSLKYDKKREMIIFDHLSPEAPGLAEFREYYIPDMSYDAYEFDGKKWRLKEDIIAINDKSKEVVELKAYDKDADTVISVPVQNEWVNPEDPNAPIESGGHKAVLPDDVKNSDEKGKNSKVKNEKEENDFKGVSYSNLNKKEKKKKRKKRRKRKN